MIKLTNILNEWKAEEVLKQLGGRKFIAMTGAKNFVKNEKESDTYRRSRWTAPGKLFLDHMAVEFIEEVFF